ncbi:hypothetical protein BC936DRAFT_143788 [Jimgerdemannia flammicorona]|uniref:Uncharacterized protein n=1 Tax=Jimgerdemannia flammicorona TaxID=994334 RepID=A0A432ZYH5_9FUNG|nr:hypothetical protein BC936DRAFT_143788 [Jimgerdemannia flammicorona]
MSDLSNTRGLDYLLNTPCGNWDAVAYHRAWKAAKLPMAKATVTAAFRKQLTHYAEIGVPKEKKRAKQLLKEFEVSTSILCCLLPSSRVGVR